MSDYRRYFVPGAMYFFTVVTYRRYPFFYSDQAGKLLRNAVESVQKDMPFDEVASVVLPDHFHCLWKLPRGDVAYSKRMKMVKARFTQDWLEAGGYEVPVTKAQKERGNRGIWQKRFWEHTIRDTDDFENHFDYIHYNPVKHRLVASPFDWIDSTIHRYLAIGHYSIDWGRQPVERLRDLDYE